MTPTDVINSWFEEVWNQENRDAIDEWLAEECEIRGLTPEPIRNRDDMKAFFDQMNAALDDIHIDVTMTVEAGNLIAALFTVTAIHSVTGRPFAQQNACFGSVENNQIKTSQNVVDFLSLFVQAGILPEDALAQGLSAGRIA